MNKLALCIGNAAYPDAPLKNAVNDANDIAACLASLGFKLQVLTNSPIKEMDEALKKFRATLPTMEIGLFFFAGHGMQIAGENYLTAVDTDFETETDAKYSSLRATRGQPRT